MSVLDHWLLRTPQGGTNAVSVLTRPIRVDRCGQGFIGFGIIDCMYMPVVSRLRTYGITLEGAAADYAASMWEQPAVQAWAAVAQDSPATPRYDAMLGSDA